MRQAPADPFQKGIDFRAFLLNALLILPAASSRNIAENVREYHLFSVIFSLFSGILGLFVSYYTDMATGPMIVIFASVIFFATYFYGRNR